MDTLTLAMYVGRAEGIALALQGLHSPCAAIATRLAKRRAVQLVKAECRAYLTQATREAEREASTRETEYAMANDATNPRIPGLNA